MKTARLVAPALLLLALAACGDADPAAAPTTTMADMGGTTMAAMGDDEMGDMEHEHEHDGAVTAWEGRGPELSLTVEDGPDGKVAVLDAAGFEFSDPSRTVPVPGQGHTHVWIDGRLLTMSYDPAVPLGDLEPGMHEIEVTLAANDHSDYVIDEEVVGVSTMVEVAGEVAAADVTIEVSYANGSVGSTLDADADLGSVVEIIVTSDVADELHVHGYDIVVDVAPGEPAVARFTADIAGIFEVELEQSGTPLLELTVS